MSTPPAILVQAAANYHATQQAITQGSSTTVFNKDATAWHQWRRFCSWLQIAPDLEGIEDPIPFLHVFDEHVRAGLLSAQGQPIKNRLVDQYLRYMSQILASMGSDNPCHN